MAARSTRWPPACCRSRSARRPRPSPAPWPGARPIASRCAGARRATPTTPRARSSRRARCGPDAAAIAAALPRFTGDDPAAPARLFRRSRSTASAPMTWPAAAQPSTLAPRPVEIDALRPARPARRRPRRVRGGGRQGHLYPRPRPRPRRGARHLRPCHRAAPPRGRAASPWTDAISLDKLAALGHSAAASGHLLPIETALDDIPALALTEAEAHRLALRPVP